MACNRGSSTGSQEIPGTTFINWAQNVTVYPERYFHPASIDEVVAIVRAAEGDTIVDPNGASVRVVGSGWSFTDILSTPDYLVRTDKLNHLLSATLPANPNPPPPGADDPLPLQPPPQPDPVFAAFTDVARKKNLVHVEAGALIHDLNFHLERFFLSSVVDGQGNTHGFALPTLGGSGGQSIVGAIATSTHGGDVELPPVPDMVRAIHLVGPGGVEWWLEPKRDWQVVDPARLQQDVPCLEGHVVFDDDLFYSALVACGRMGIIYSIVIEVREQFFLLETRSQTSFLKLTEGALQDLRDEGGYLEILCLPYGEPMFGTGYDHTCFVTQRLEVDPAQFKGPMGAPQPNAFTLACERPELGGLVEPLVGALTAQAALLSAIPIVGPWLAAPFWTAAAALQGTGNIGETLAAVVNVSSTLGFVDQCKTVVNAILAMTQSPGTTRVDLGFKVMDTWDYKGQCYKARSVEVAFDADGQASVGYVSKVFEAIDALAQHRTIVGAYLSLRYCARSSAWMAIEQWPNTVCIEIASLAGINGEEQVLQQFEQAASDDGATVHWGQLNHRRQVDIKARYANLWRFRQSLIRLADGGPLHTFDNRYCAQRGLEPWSVRAALALSGVRLDGNGLLSVQRPIPSLSAYIVGL